MRFSEFLAEIKASMKQYDSANLLDPLSIHNWVVEGMRRFGSIPTIQIEKSIEVKNRKASLPEGFKSLVLALKCEPYRYECDEKGQDVLQQYYFYKTWESSHTQHNICDPCESTETQSCIVEKVHFHNGGKAHFYYNQPTWLRLVNYMKKDVNLSDCINLRVKSSPYEISINNKTVYTNFNKGVIYMVYKGYEEDEDGFVIIPETNQGWLKQYLEYNVKRRIVEDILTNSDNTTNEQSLYQIYQSNELQSFSNAKTELKFKGMSIGIKNYQKKIKKELSVYNFGNDYFPNMRNGRSFY